MTETNEIWRPVKGYENYEVSNLGRVKVLNYHKTGKSKIKAPKVNRYGYSNIQLSRNGVKKDYGVHRLVAEAFIPNPDNKSEIDHIDADKTNNVVWLNQDGSVNYDKTNLRWCSHRENCNNPLTKERQTKRKLRPVILLSSTGKVITYFESGNVASRFLNCSISMITQVSKGKRNFADGKRLIKFEDYEQYY